MSGTVRVVVVGGGYAGVMAANRLLARRSGGVGVPAPVDVVLVDPAPRFTERIRLHAVAAGARASAGRDWADVLHPRVRRVTARAVRLDTATRHVLLDDGARVPYDHAVLAVGSGARAGALHSVTDTAGAERTRAAIADLAPGEAVTVAGAGPTGLEVACAVAVARPDLSVTVVDPAGPPAGEPAVARRLARLRVDVVAGTVDPTTGAVTAVDGRTRAASPVTVWTVGFTVPGLAADSGLPVAPDGRLLVDETLTVPGHDHLVGAGDAVVVDSPRGAHLRMSCAAAIPLGAHAADTVLARVAGVPPRPLDVGFAALCLDLGAGHGHVRFVGRDDAPRPWAVRGRPAGWVKEGICRATVSWLAAEARRPGRYRTPVPGPAVPGASAPGPSVAADA
ncbi:FAD-dependent oxidoreductase [Cellulomonas sp. JZ18]|uniref:NAD(P)/FAD-dependent oxidoreductase n=1 Tax=Cellulomonas sp. JZ18 TaxID=2654191 RepID=UPI0012D39E39|nr:FAD-dependent oxidoreductase [Cellulomonas sp. JZ18]QGQ19292.1 FAD-dependent oxidoreductase [Cellulomonas sp. JZ18]